MEHLLAAYQERLAQSQPLWAQRKYCSEGILPPTIPFVGEKYENARILLYASAENLSHYQGHLENGSVNLMDRHRYYFDESQKAGRFYPFVHCAPVNDGSLLLAAAYLCEKMGLPVCEELPSQFLEGIAFGNFGKFSIQAKENHRNQDYAGDAAFLRASLPYVEEDLKALEPSYVILPKTIFNQEEVRELLEKWAPKAKYLPIYQINVGNVNRIISRRYPRKKPDSLSPILARWYEELCWPGKSKENYRSVFSYLDDNVYANSDFRCSGRIIVIN